MSELWFHVGAYRRRSWCIRYPKEAEDEASSKHVQRRAFDACIYLYLPVSSLLNLRISCGQIMIEFDVQKVVVIQPSIWSSNSYTSLSWQEIILSGQCRALGFPSGNNNIWTGVVVEEEEEGQVYLKLAQGNTTVAILRTWKSKRLSLPSTSLASQKMQSSCSSIDHSRLVSRCPFVRSHPVCHRISSCLHMSPVKSCLPVSLSLSLLSDQGDCYKWTSHGVGALKFDPPCGFQRWAGERSMGSWP